jgi:hypothetical protein
MSFTRHGPVSANLALACHLHFFRDELNIPSRWHCYPIPGSQNYEVHSMLHNKLMAGILLIGLFCALPASSLAHEGQGKEMGMRQGGGGYGPGGGQRQDQAQHGPHMEGGNHDMGGPQSMGPSHGQEMGNRGDYQQHEHYGPPPNKESYGPGGGGGFEKRMGPPPSQQMGYNSESGGSDGNGGPGRGRYESSQGNHQGPPHEQYRHPEGQGGGNYGGRAQGPPPNGGQYHHGPENSGQPGYGQ